LELESGSSSYAGAGDVSIKSGHGKYNMGGSINIIASHTEEENRQWYKDQVGTTIRAKEINFGFDEVSTDGLSYSSSKREVSLQLRKIKNSTRLVSTGMLYMFLCNLRQNNCIHFFQSLAFPPTITTYSAYSSHYYPILI